MKEIQTKSEKILCIEVFEDCYSFYLSIYGENTKAEHTKLNWKSSVSNNMVMVLPGGRRKIVGKLSELTDKDCEEFVEFKNIKSFCNCEYCGYDIDCYRDYVNQSDDDWVNYPVADRLNLAKESFISLLQSEGINTSKEYLIIKLLCN